MHPHKGKSHKITINQNLNKYSFLITLVHEVAHLTTWNKYKNKTLPHGLEWKEEFRIHLKPAMELEIFPYDVVDCLKNFNLNPRASGCTDVKLIKVLRKYDEQSMYVHLDEIPNKCIFRLKDGREFIKDGLIRKRYKCIDLKSKHVYLISPVEEVIQTTLF